MNRSIIEAPQGADMVRSVVRIEDDPKPGDGMMGFVALGTLLQDIAGQPYLLRHAGDCPGEVRITYDGQKWVVEAVTITVRPRE
jgi:hypothetical protein